MEKTTTPPAVPKTPWFIHDGSNGPELHANPVEGDEPIADIPTDAVGDREAIAEFIVRACNAHDELVEVCTSQLENWRMLRSGEWDGNRGGIELAIRDLERALSKAKGHPS